MIIPEGYTKKINSRCKLRFFAGFCLRLMLFSWYSIPRLIARMKGASIGDSSIIPLKLAIRSNKNLVVGNDVIIETSLIDTREKVIIGDHCIINKGVEIIRLSHFIDNDEMFSTRYFDPLFIDSYSWLATGSKILPRCNMIANGSVIGAYSVLTTNTNPMGVYAGNPACIIRYHNSKFQDTVVVSLKGGDLKYYVRCRG